MTTIPEFNVTREDLEALLFADPKGGNYTESLAENRIRDLKTCLMASALWRILPCLEAQLATGGGNKIKGADGRTWYFTLTGVDADDVPSSVTLTRGAGRHHAFSLSIRDESKQAGRPRATLVPTFGGDEGDWRVDFADLVHDLRPLLDRAPPLPHELCMLVGFDYYMPAIIASDGGLPGEYCLDLVHRLEDAMLLAVARLRAPTLAANIRALHGHKLIWGERQIAYGDEDKRCGAVPCAGLPSPKNTSPLSIDGFDRLAVVHENIDLFDSFDRFLVVVDTDGKGCPVTVFGYDLPRGPDAEAEHPDMPTTADLMRRLAAGAELPEPVFSADLTDGTITRGARFHVSGLPGYLGHVAKNDAWIVGRLAAGKMPSDACIYKGDSPYPTFPK